MNSFIRIRRPHDRISYISLSPPFMLIAHVLFSCSFFSSIIPQTRIRISANCDMTEEEKGDWSRERFFSPPDERKRIVLWRQTGRFLSESTFFFSLVSRDYPMEVPRMDVFSRILIVFASFFSIAALALSIVGIATPYWYYSLAANGNTFNYNLFTQCNSSISSGASVCTDIARQTSFGVATLYAAAFLVVAICLLGCAVLVLLLMNCVQITGLLVFIPPILLFVSALFMVATFAEGSRVALYNGYSAILVQTSHVLTIFSMGITALAGGRLHLRHYEQF